MDIRKMQPPYEIITIDPYLLFKGIFKATE